MKVSPSFPDDGFSLSSGSLVNGQLNGSGSKGGHKQDGSLHSKGHDGSSKYGEDGPAKKRWDCEAALKFHTHTLSSSSFSVCVFPCNEFSSAKSMHNVSELH